MPWGLRTGTGRTACEQGALPYTAHTMFRWFIVVFLALMLIGWLTPLLGKLGFGKLPGDLRFRLFGRDWSIPLASTIVLSLLASMLAKLM